MTLTKTRNSEALLIGMASGEEAAFRRLYEAEADWVYAIALRILRDSQAAEDAVQEAFIKLWRTASRFDPALGSAKTWIGIIARNAALDLGRRRQPVEELDEGHLATLATEAVEPPDPKLGKCLDELPRDQARAIVTMYSYGLSHSELSETLALPLGTVKSWIRRGTQSLKLCMEG
ncbi:RNA polymerase sigma factor [Novosphingobium sp. JCM 18896]|uniref:RNA polymerase sigma factor n=1 Tax=Novosphingobium sp. JCM 18896 TaxID=2989731 RepID=UPI0022218E3A|nr:sigma-70 family RNA polymerase sigma factor [Novosphingobium sp. JCM 18896]MCW1427818.1 sigma-70 family RNA polymerase sigma factor [Novosphingobium sp. JCM 18896]